ncbi:VOC family protein [Rhizorhabdus argentea]|uniref:VOC family protein n=1 Tax=Rhizorhabdus argentea TaxID=1387174 RepID=UPI0030EE8DA7
MTLLPVTGLYHSGVVVDDCLRSIENFSRIFGIPVWEAQTLTNADFREPRVHGQDLPQHFMSAVAMNGPVGFELCESLAGDRSVYGQFKAEAGLGLQHVFYTILDQSEFAATERRLAEARIAPAQSAIISDTVDYYYFDTIDSLGAYAELLVVKGPNPAGGPPDVHAFGPEVTELPGRAPIDRLYRYVVVTSDIDQTRASYSQFYGVTDWRTLLLVSADGHTRRSFAGRAGQLAVELVDAASAPQLATRLGRANGPRLSHLTVSIYSPDEADAALSWFQDQGMSVAEKLATPDGLLEFVRLDGRSLLDGVDLEIIVRKPAAADPVDALYLAP